MPPFMKNYLTGNSNYVQNFTYRRLIYGVKGFRNFACY